MQKLSSYIKLFYYLAYALLDAEIVTVQSEIFEALLKVLLAIRLH